MSRFIFITAFFLGFAACNGCGEDSIDTDASAPIDSGSANADGGIVD